MKSFSPIKSHDAIVSEKVPTGRPTGEIDAETPMAQLMQSFAKTLKYGSSSGTTKNYRTKILGADIYGATVD